MALDDQLHIARFATLSGLCGRNEDVSQFGLDLRVQMDFGLLHPNCGVRRAIESLHQGW